MSAARYSQTGTLLPNGKVLIAGGASDGSAASTLASAELFDPATGTFSPTGSMSEVREAHTATLLNDGRVLIAGGDDGSNALSTAETYDPATGIFSPAPSMPVARTQHTATLLQDGDVLIAGGLDGTSVLKTAILFEPDDDTYADTGDMTSARSYETATLLHNGRVLITGGFLDASWTVLATAETYNPATNTFTATGSMTQARALHSATQLPDGRVFLFGGQAPGPGSDARTLSSAEFYDPADGTFVSAGSAAAAREVHTATLLKDGRVLIVGGKSLGQQTTVSSSSPSPVGSQPVADSTPVPRLGSAELFQP
jgi:hypothetical protein